ncbi:MAG TPA: long-chain fatty acid--CoA ligase [Solirubrobacterales bacterium]
MVATVPELLIEAERRHPRRSAMTLGGTAVDYAAFEDVSARLAARLADLGVGAGDRVALMLPNVPEFPAAYYAVLRRGAIVVPVNVMLNREEVATLLRDAGAKLLIGWHALAAEAGAAAAEAGAGHLELGAIDLARSLRERERLAVEPRAAADATAVLLYTSGTTGTPKGAELTHANLVGNARAAASIFELAPEDTVMGVLPLFHSFGQTCTLNAVIAAGASLSLIPRFSAEAAWEAIGAGATVVAGVPTMYTALLAAPAAERPVRHSVRLCLAGGSSLSVEVLKQVESAFGCPVLEGYGLSETSPVASFNGTACAPKPGSVGTPIPGVEMRIVDDAGRQLGVGEVGEIVIRGENVMKGYWRRPEDTAEAMRGGWFHSGDLGRIDEDGCFFVVDRKKDVVIRAGYNVYPRELEDVLHAHPAVREAAVLGVADATLGEEVGAAVVLTEPGAASAEELREFVRGRVAPYKYPRIVEIFEDLPKGGTGKVLKREIRLRREPADAASQGGEDVGARG